MATLPSSNDIKRRELTPTRSVISYNGGGVERAKAEAAQRVGQANQNLGTAIAQVGEVVARSAEREQDRLDRVLISEAESENIRDNITALSIRAREVKGSGVLASDYLKGLESDYDSKAKEIRAKLKTPKQQAAFDESSRRGKTSLLTSTMEYAAGETEKAKAVSYDTAIRASIAMTASQPDNVGAFHDAVGNVVSLAMVRADELGMEPEPAKQFIHEAHGAVAMAFIDAQREAGLVDSARQMFDASKKVMTQEQIKAVEHRLKPVVEHTYGAGIGEEVFKLREAGKLSAVEAQKYINEKTKGRPEANAAAEMAIKEFEHAKRVDYEQSAGTVLNSFFQQGATAASYNSLVTTKEFLSLDAPAQGKLREHLLTQIRVADRADKTDDSAQWKTPEALEKFYSAMNDPTLATKTPEQLASMALEIGPANSVKLANRQKELRTGAAKFSIDADLLKEAIPKKLFASENKVKLAAFKGIVESNLADWKDRNPGAIPSLEDQKKIARSALVEYEEAGILWGTNKKPLYEAPETEREKRRLESQRPAWESDMRAQAALRGIVLTSEKLQAMWAKKTGSAK